MKKEQFRTMVKEIIKEVITEMNVSEDTDVEADETPTDFSDIGRPTSNTDKRWRGKMRTLDKIKSEPGFQDKLRAIQQKKGDEPLPHKTSYK